MSNGEKRPAGRTHDRRPTLRDVAALAGVDPSLVSRIVNNDPKAASTAETRQRVLDIVAQVGYRPSVTARALQKSRTMTVGLLLPDLANPIYVEVARGVESAARAAGYGVVIGGREDFESQHELTRLLADGRVDGLIVASGTLHDEALSDLAEHGTAPIVVVNRNVNGVDASVTVDDAAGAALAVEHLASLGHSRVTGLFGPASIETTQRRKDGFRATVGANGMTAVEVDADAWSTEAGYRQAIALLAAESPPTAIFASTFLMGIGVLRAAQDRGVKIPEDLSVIALHDSELAEYLIPRLTTVRMPTTRMGCDAFELLLEIVNGGEPRRQVVPQSPSLAVRQSTAAPR